MNSAFPFLILKPCGKYSLRNSYIKVSKSYFGETATEISPPFWSYCKQVSIAKLRICSLDPADGLYNLSQISYYLKLLLDKFCR